MNTIKTQVHTIIMLIGPSGSGKTTFAEKVLIPQLERPFDKTKNFKPNIQYISSDKIRQEILGVEFNKLDNVMTESSENAFKLLNTKLDVVTSYPINAEYVILDTTGLSEQFRKDVLAIAEKNNYNVDAIIFDYKKMDEYKKTFEYHGNGKQPNGKIIATHVKRLRTQVLKTIKSDLYRNITKIKDKNFVIEKVESGIGLHSYLVPTYNVDVWDYNKYIQRILPIKYDWVIIGDVHSCVDELVELLEKYGFVIDGDIIKDTEASKNKGIIFAGDLFDKAPDEEIKKAIRFFHTNMKFLGERFQLILGNHDEINWKWITDHPSLEKTEKRIEERKKYYTTSFILENNPEFQVMFLELFAHMKGWVKTIETDKNSFIVTHAPCEVKYLEKMDKKSLHNQVICASRSKNKDKTNDEITPYLMEEAVKNHPIHVFGHMGQTKIRTFKNKVCIDTGCVYGYSLTGYTVGFGNKPFVHSVKAKGAKEALNDYNTELFSFSAKEEMYAVNIDDLSDSDQRRLEYIMKNGIGYIGGTISPSDKDTETGELESLKSGLDHYRDKVDKVVLEPKYMGSRSQTYLHRNIEKCYATSRNGYKIKQVDLTPLFKVELKKHEALMNELDIEELVLDGELMPWAAIGEGLIERQFRVIDKAIKSEIDFLDINGFDEAFSKLADEWAESGYDTDRTTLNKKDLREKYGHTHQNYKYVKTEFDRWQPTEIHREAWKVYNEQVEIYGSTGEIHYKPFRILKGIKNDGTIIDISLDTFEQFTTINEDDVLVVDFTDEDYQEKANEWFNEITLQQKLEGCVIKPLDSEFNMNITPYMKVRNPRYLTLIYGYDMYFPKKFEKLFNQKNISKKVKASKIEYRLGEQMLGLDITSDEFKQTIANFMFENEKEKGIDPRL